MPMTYSRAQGLSLGVGIGTHLRLELALVKVASHVHITTHVGHWNVTGSLRHDDVVVPSPLMVHA